MDDRNHDSERSAPEGAPTPGSEAGVGYGRQPKHTRFPPGQSGNRPGRPRGARGRKKIIEEIARETHVVIEGGRRLRRSTLELVLLSLRNLALEGNIKAFRALHKLLQRYGPQEPRQRGRPTIIPKLTQEEWERGVRDYRERMAKLTENEMRLRDERRARRDQG